MIEFECSSENIRKTIEHDYFNRNKLLIALIDILNKTSECSTYAIDGTWGCGKTVFAHQLMELLSDSELYDTIRKTTELYEENPEEAKIKYKGLYFNAWENDLVKNPSINLIYTLIEKYALFEDDPKGVYKDLFNILTNVAVKVASGGTLSISDFRATEDDPEVKKLINAKDLKDLFNRTISSIKEVSNADKIVIVIDELDRCRPSYAVELLENLKHFYDNKDLIFIITTDLTQLVHTVRKLYGSSFDADLYLQRFFDGFFSLKMPDVTQYIEQELEYAIGKRQILHDICKYSINYYSLSIREINKYIKQIKLLEANILEAYSFDHVGNGAKLLFVPWGLALKYKNVSLFNKFRAGLFSKEDLLDYFSLNDTALKWIYECWKGGQYDYVREIALEELVAFYYGIFNEESIKSDVIRKDEDKKFTTYNRDKITLMLDF